jgi:FkbM family methyltransferase
MTTDTPPLPLAYRLYRRLLARHQRAPGSLFARTFEATIAAAVRVRAALGPPVFPRTAIGGWWWTWRWRFEVLAGWSGMESIAWCRRLVRPGMTVVDAGAHIGYYTRLFSRLVGARGKVYAFEPHPDNFALLARNAARPNVSRYSAAVGASSGTATLHLSPGSSNHSLHAGYTESRGTIAVEQVALDDWLAAGRIGTVDFVKIDVEGGEPGALAGMVKLLHASARAALLVELNPQALACGGVTAADFVRQIGKLGFEPLRIDEHARLHPLDETRTADATAGAGSVNLLCRRPRA